MTRQLYNSLKTQKKQSAPKNLQIAGSLGIALGGQKRVEVPNRNSFVYVRINDNPNEVAQVFNNKVAPSYGLPVILEWQTNRYVVQGVDTARYQNNWNSFTPFLPRHGNTHSFDDGTTGGAGDIVWVYPRQFIPSLIIPSGSAGANNVLMSQYTIKNADGSWRFVGNTGTQSLTPYIPTTGTQAVMALVYMDSASGNPYLAVGSGSYFANTITGSADVVPYIPTLSNPNYIPLAAIRLVTGTSAIRWTNIYDVRQFIHTTPTGSGGGGISDAPVDGNLYGRKNAGWTIITGSGGGASGSDSTYYRLDTANNPLTGRIIIRPSGTNRWTADPTVVGTGTNTLIDGDQTLSNDGNLLLLANNGSPKTKIAAQGNIEFGLGSLSTKEVNAGKIGYELFTSGYLEVVGAGSSAPNRWIRAYDNLKVDSHLQTNTVQTLNLKNSWPYANATGTFVGPNGATDISSTVTGSSYLLATDPSYNSGLVTVDGVINYAKYSVMPNDGWITVSQVWTYASSDSPVYQFYASGDVSGDSNYKLGNKIKCLDTGSGYVYGIIVKVGSYDFGNNRTPVDVYMGTDYSLTGNTIILPQISKIKSPDGFSLDPDKWTVSLTDTSNAVINTPTNNTYYSVGNLSITLPIGKWRVFYNWTGNIVVTTTALRNIGLVSALSTATGSVSDMALRMSQQLTGPTGANSIILIATREKLISVTSKTIYYPIVLGSVATDAITSVAIRGDLNTSVVKAICAYL